jgi:hypothetical protein
MSDQSLQRRVCFVGEQVPDINCGKWTNVEERRTYVVDEMDELENIHIIILAQ